MTTTPKNNPNTSDEWRQTLLDWTAKQGRILTDEGKAIDHYCSERGFSFAPNELPHYHLERGDTHQVFHRWAVAAAAASSDQEEEEAILSSSSPIVGAWSRPLFTGKWEQSTDREETVYNIQTGSLFIDLRIPTSKPVSRWENLPVGGGDDDDDSSRQAFESMSDEDLRLYARQHVFAGYSVISHERNNNNNSNSNNRMSNNLPLCTRHHCIDWNYVSGKPRPRPNKWYIEGRKNNNTNNNGNNTPPFHTWKEWSYATDENGQCYYWEKWERIAGDEFGRGLRLAMRKKQKQRGGPISDGVVSKDDDSNNDAILVAVGDHFNYIVGRQFLDLQQQQQHTRYRDAGNTVELVDLAIQHGDREIAISHLSLAGGHGTISSGWKIDCAVQPWQHGKNVFDCLSGNCCNEQVKVIGSSGGNTGCISWEVVIGNDSWDVYECSLSKDELQQLLLSRKMSRL